MESADYQLWVGVDSDRQIAAADATADDQRSISWNIKQTARMRPAKRPARSQDWCAVRKADLATVGMTCKTDCVLVTFKGQQSIR